MGDVQLTGAAVAVRTIDALIAADGVVSEIVVDSDELELLTGLAAVALA